MVFLFVRFPLVRRGRPLLLDLRVLLLRGLVLLWDPHPPHNRWFLWSFRVVLFVGGKNALRSA